MGEPFEIFLTIVVLSFWFLFPIGMFISVSHVDKNTDQVVRLDHLRHYSVPESEITSKEAMEIPIRKEKPLQRPRAVVFHRRWTYRH